jgi:molybdate transport system regulatory protein
VLRLIPVWQRIYDSGHQLGVWNRLSAGSGKKGYPHPRPAGDKKEVRHMSSLRLRSRHWIVNEDGDIIIGEGRQEILENIEKTGSINKTAKIMKMSYKGVWSKIKATEGYLKLTIVATNKKRGSQLTKEGKELLEKYKTLKKKCLEADDKIFRILFK